MKLTTTKTFANFLQKQFKNYKFSQEKLTESQFSFYVDYDIYENEPDYDYETNKYNVIKVLYPQNYYATPTYITTKLINILYKKANNNFDTFLKLLKDEIEI